MRGTRLCEDKLLAANLRLYKRALGGDNGGEVCLIRARIESNDSMITDCLHRVAACRESLTRDEARAVMAEILRGEATDAQIAGLLVALNMKGESVEEIVGFAEAMRAAASPMESLRAEAGALDVSGTEREALVDTCGTGGDASGTVNISTATAFVAAV